MGFMKRTDSSYKQNIKKSDEESFTCEKESKIDGIYVPVHDPLPKLKSYEEKAEIKKNLANKFDGVAERVITLALETADYDEERAEQILKVSAINDDQKNAHDLREKRRNSEIHVEDKVDYTKTFEKSFRDSGIWEKTSPDSYENKSTEHSSCSPDISCGSKNTRETESAKSSVTINAVQNTNELSTKNVTNELQGALISTTGIKLCAKIIPKGANKALLGSRYISKGRNRELLNGPQKGLAKGSIFGVKMNTTQKSIKNNDKKCLIS